MKLSQINHCQLNREKRNALTCLKSAIKAGNRFGICSGSKRKYK